MSWSSDSHGIAFKSNDIKLWTDGTWGMKLNQLYRMSAVARVITYSLPDEWYLENFFSKRSHDFYVICHAKFYQRAAAIKDKYPLLNIAVCNDVHSKICLIEPATVYISSANWGNSHWHETTIGIRSSEAYDWYLNQSFNPLWDRCRVIA